MGVGRNPDLEVPNRLLRGGTVKEIYEMKGAGRSIREIARELRAGDADCLRGDRKAILPVATVCTSAYGQIERPASL